MSSILIVVTVAILAIAALAYAKIVVEKTGTASDYRGKPLLSDNEKEFYQRLKRALPEFEVFTQVAMGAILAPNADRNSRRYHQIRGSFSQKIIDFLVCDPSLKVVAIIELDDRTHNASRDEKRDAMLQCANYRVLRWQSRNKPSEEEIRAKVTGGRPSATSAVRGVRAVDVQGEQKI